MELRQLRYFVALSEELNFARAAEREHLAPAAFSEQIQRLERELDVQLARRTTRTVVLTDAGTALLPVARRALQAAHEVTVTAASLARAEQGALRLGLATSVLAVTSSVVGAFRRQYPQVRLEVVPGDLADPSAGLASGSTDAALVWGPYSSPQHTTHLLRTEPRWVVLPEGHPLAARSSLRAADLLAETWCDVPAVDPVFRSFWLLDELRHGVPARLGPAATTPVGLVELVAAGQGITLLPRVVVTPLLGSGVRAVAVQDVPPCEIRVAVPSAPSRVAAAFAEVARMTAAEHASVRD